MGRCTFTLALLALVLLLSGCSGSSSSSQVQTSALQVLRDSDEQALDILLQSAIEHDESEQNAVSADDDDDDDVNDGADGDDEHEGEKSSSDDDDGDNEDELLEDDANEDDTRRRRFRAAPRRISRRLRRLRVRGKCRTTIAFTPRNRRHAMLLKLRDAQYIQCLKNTGAKLGFLQTAAGSTEDGDELLQSADDADELDARELLHNAGTEKCAHEAIARIKNMFPNNSVYQNCLGEISEFQHTMPASFLATGSEATSPADSESDSEIGSDDDENDNDDDDDATEQQSAPEDIAAHEAALALPAEGDADNEQATPEGQSSAASPKVIQRTVDGEDPDLASPDVLTALAEDNSKHHRRHHRKHHRRHHRKHLRRRRRHRRRRHRHRKHRHRRRRHHHRRRLRRHRRHRRRHGRHRRHRHHRVRLTPLMRAQVQCLRQKQFAIRDARRVRRCQRSGRAFTRGVIPHTVEPSRFMRHPVSASVRARVLHDAEVRRALGKRYYRKYRHSLHHKHPSKRGMRPRRHSSGNINQTLQLRLHASAVNQLAMKAAKPLLRHYLKWFSSVYVPNGGIIPIMRSHPFSHEVRKMYTKSFPLMPRATAAAPPKYPPWMPLPSLKEPNIYDPQTLPGTSKKVKDNKIWKYMPKPRPIRKVMITPDGKIHAIRKGGGGSFGSDGAGGSRRRHHRRQRRLRKLRRLQRLRKLRRLHRRHHHHRRHHGLQRHKRRRRVGLRKHRRRPRRHHRGLRRHRRRHHHRRHRRGLRKHRRHRHRRHRHRRHRRGLRKHRRHRHRRHRHRRHRRHGHRRHRRHGLKWRARLKVN